MDTLYRKEPLIMIQRIASAALTAIVLMAVRSAFAAEPLCGDVNQTDSVTATDALLVLKNSVGQPVELQCPAFATKPTCGNDDAEPGEVCDGPDVRGKTCASETPETPYGIVECDACNTLFTGACTGRFDVSGSTIIDRQYGLEWERKDASNGTANLADVHDADNLYTWGSALAPPPDGTAFTEFIGRLNGSAGGGCYNQSCDWRLPTETELHTIVVVGCANPPCVVDSAFLPAISDYYWSSTTYFGAPNGAVAVEFSDYINDLGDGKSSAHYVRAVRTRN
jgi:hypothetical protein